METSLPNNMSLINTTLHMLNDSALTSNLYDNDTNISNPIACSLAQNYVTVTEDEWIVFGISFLLTSALVVFFTVKASPPVYGFLKFMTYFWIVLRCAIFSCLISILITSFITLGKYPVSTAEVSQNPVTWNLIWNSQDAAGLQSVVTFDIVMWALGIFVSFALYVLITYGVSYTAHLTEDNGRGNFCETLFLQIYVAICAVMVYAVFYGIAFTFTTVWIPMFQFSLYDDCNCIDGYVVYTLQWFLYMIGCWILAVFWSAVAYCFEEFGGRGIICVVCCAAPCVIFVIIFLIDLCGARWLYVIYLTSNYGNEAAFYFKMQNFVVVLMCVDYVSCVFATAAYPFFVNW